MAKSKAQLDREVMEMLGTTPARGVRGSRLTIKDPDIAKMFKQSGSKGTLGEHDKTVEAVLGDPMYHKHFKMPKWNRKATILDTPDVAIRHWNELGISRSKNAHAQRAEHFQGLRDQFKVEHNRLIREGERAYGENGSVIAGGFHDDWPDAIKDRIRFVSYGTTLLTDAARLHEALSKSRSPVFQ